MLVGLPDTRGESSYRNASIDDGKVTRWVNNCRANSQEARLLYP
jgi:hypothetical protein